MEESRGEETVWDVVILGDGTKADVIEPRSHGYAGEGVESGGRMLKRSSSFISTSGEPQTFQAVTRSEPRDDEGASQVSIQRRNNGFEEDLQFSGKSMKQPRSNSPLLLIREAHRMTQTQVIFLVTRSSINRLRTSFGAQALALEIHLMYL